MSLLLLHLIQVHWTTVSIYFIPLPYTETFCAKNCLHSCSPHELETSLTKIPSHNTEGETCTPFCRENFTARQTRQESALVSRRRTY
jgi:hypothetical protein